MKIKPNIAVSDNGFIFNPGSGESYTVNPVGLDIINLMRKGKSNPEIVEAIQQNFAVEQLQAERDLLDFVEMMRQYRLLQYDDE
jgi:hypothetical protein